jgi:peptidoglycan hydrolase-like protein with peptidoglycan-binding domain
LEVSREIDKIVSEWNNEISETTDKTQNNLSETREDIEKSNPFSRTLDYKKPYMRGEDVRALQEFLNSNGFNTNGVD